MPTLKKALCEGEIDLRAHELKLVMLTSAKAQLFSILKLETRVLTIRGVGII